jgi:hypothetical protein
MATTTPNYGWDVPTSTDYVKDGATAIETLGDDIDASLFSITSGKNVGLVHINTTSFSAQSTVSLNNVFTTAFDNYRIIFEASGSTTSQNVGARLRVAGADNTASTYNQQIGEFSGSSAAGFRENNANIWTRISTVNSTSPVLATMDIASPALSRFTTQTGTRQVEPTTSTQIQLVGSAFANTTVFDGISFIVGTGTMTGTVRVYGYRNS